MDFALNTRRASCELILHEYGSSIPIRTCSEYNKRRGFTPQKSAERANEQNSESAAKWIEKTNS